MAFVSVLFAACQGHKGSADNSVAQKQALQEQTANLDAVPAEKPPCAFEVAGTDATFKNVEGGIAVDFVTSGDVQELRRRVHGRTAYGQAHPQPTPFKMHKKVEDIENGVRLIVLADDAQNADKLRAGVTKKLNAAKQKALEKLQQN